MASAVVVGGALFKIYAVNPMGSRNLVAQGETTYWGAGKSPDGVIANSPEKWAYIPLSPLVLTGGWKVLPTVTIHVTADGMDVSDGAWQIPVTIKGVGLRHLSVTDCGGADLAASTTIGVEHDLGTGYTVPQGQELRIGGGKIFMSAEDDA